MIRVLLCAPFNGSVGGISRWTKHVLDYYDKIEHKKSELLVHNTKRKEGIYANDPTIKRLRTGIKDYSQIIKHFKRIIDKNNIDIVHIVSSASLGLIRDIVMLKLAKTKKIKTIVHFRFGRIPHLFKIRNWEQKLLHCVINMSDKVIVLDRASYDTLISEGFKNIELLPNPLTPRISDLIIKNKDIERKKRKLIFTGHVVLTKGVFELTEACVDIPNIELKLIGAVTDEMKQKLYTIAGPNATDWLQIVGEYSFEDTIKEMLSANILILPSYTEGFPNVILEGMACGCPIIATRVGAIPEMLVADGDVDCGICIDPRNTSQLRRAILKFLDSGDFAIQCGLNAQSRVNKIYSMPEIYNKLENIWHSFFKS